MHIQMQLPGPVPEAANSIICRWPKIWSSTTRRVPTGLSKYNFGTARVTVRFFKQLHSFPVSNKQHCLSIEGHDVTSVYTEQ